MRRATLTKLLSVSVTEEMLGLFKSLADSDNVSVGQMVRTGLDYALEHENEWRKFEEKNPGNRSCFRFDPSDGDGFILGNADSGKEMRKHD